MNTPEFTKIDVSDVSLNDNGRFKMESSFNDNSNLSTIPELDTPVLGVFSGIFAKLDSMSVNKRFYSADFWRKVLARPEVKHALKVGSMLGIFEHPNVTKNFTKDGLVTARHPQNAAFVVKRLWIEGNNVMGEAYLLNTPLGRLLGTYFKAKDRFGKPLIQLCISARSYSEEDYFDDRGIDIMNPNDYYLQSFDIVMKPGIVGAIVKMESEDEDRFILSKLESMADEVSTYMNSKHEEYKTIASELKNEWGLKSVII